MSQDLLVCVEFANPLWTFVVKYRFQAIRWIASTHLDQI